MWMLMANIAICQTHVRKFNEPRYEIFINTILLTFITFT